MAIKQSLIIKDEILNEEYCIVGQSGVFKQQDYLYNNNTTLTEETNRFLLIDLWTIGVFGSENCNQQWNEEEQINITSENDIDIYTKKVIDYFNDGLFELIKQSIIQEIKEDNEETIKIKN